jgi:hypothetical protein
VSDEETVISKREWKLLFHLYVTCHLEKDSLPLQTAAAYRRVHELYEKEMENK